MKEKEKTMFPDEEKGHVPKIKIKTDGVMGTEITVNGVKLKGVRGFRFKQRAGELPVLQIDMQATDIDMDTTAIPQLPYPFTEFYVEKPIEDLE